MKVKTFTGTDRVAVDKQINDWLAKSKVAVLQTAVAFKPLSEKGLDVITGRTTTRRGMAVAITVWYKDPPTPKPMARPTNWELG
jgi:hypothetical protein